jgi:hypothetical protein
MVVTGSPCSDHHRRFGGRVLRHTPPRVWRKCHKHTNHDSKASADRYSETGADRNTEAGAHSYGAAGANRHTETRADRHSQTRADRHVSAGTNANAYPLVNCLLISLNRNKEDSGI